MESIVKLTSDLPTSVGLGLELCYDASAVYDGDFRIRGAMPVMFNSEDGTISGTVIFIFSTSTPALPKDSVSVSPDNENSRYAGITVSPAFNGVTQNFTCSLYRDHRQESQAGVR